MKNFYKCILFILAFQMFVPLSEAQSPVKKYVPIAYYDAIAIMNYTKTSPGLLDTILANYSSHVNDSTHNNSPEAIGEMLNNNPFFKNQPDIKGLLDTVKAYLKRSKTANPTQENGGNIISGPISALGNLNVTNIANGVAGFLVKRAKQELLIAVINKVKDPNKFPEIPALFPNTYKLLKSFNSWEFSNALNTLKAAFDKDLQNMLGDIPNLDTQTVRSSLNSAASKRVTAIQKFFKTPEARVFISALQIGNGALTGQKMPDIIHKIASPGYLSDIPNASPNVHNAVRLLDILNYSIRSKSPDTSYVNADNFKKLLDNDELRNIFLGLLYQQIKNEDIQFGTTKPVRIADTIAKYYKVYAGISNYLHEVVAQGGSLNTAVSNLITAKKKGEKDLSGSWAAIFESTSYLLKAVDSINTIYPSLKFPSEIQKAFNDATRTLAVANDIAVKNYSAAIVDFANFIPDFPVQKNSTKEDSSNYKHFKKFFVKYGSFAANLAQAQNADDAENAIEAVALPVGSYTVKQHADFNISVNGYLGYAFDLNYAKGIYAPIGFSFSSHYFTAFVPIFDVGSIVSYQLSNPSNTTGTSTTNGSTTSATVSSFGNNQQIKLGSIFAPGVEAFFNVPTFPISVGAGERRTPTLFYSSGQSYLTVGSKWVTNITILIDIPIFTLFNKTAE